MSEYGLDMIDLVLTHLNQSWGSLDPWRPLATQGLIEMIKNQKDHI